MLCANSCVSESRGGHLRFGWVKPPSSPVGTRPHKKYNSIFVADDIVERCMLHRSFSIDWRVNITLLIVAFNRYRANTIN
jgi:hypothetical protein